MTMVNLNRILDDLAKVEQAVQTYSRCPTNGHKGEAFNAIVAAEYITSLQGPSKDHEEAKVMFYDLRETYYQTIDNSYD